MLAMHNGDHDKEWQHNVIVRSLYQKMAAPYKTVQIFCFYLKQNVAKVAYAFFPNSFTSIDSCV